MLDAAALGGLAIHKAGTALAHNIGHALGSLAPVPHGLAVTLAMAATAEWVVEGNREAFSRVAEAMGEGGDADKVPNTFRRLATDVVSIWTRGAAAPGLTAEKLAAAMAQPENASMRKSTKRVVADEDLLPLAKRTLALGVCGSYASPSQDIRQQFRNEVCRVMPMPLMLKVLAMACACRLYSCTRSAADPLNCPCRASERPTNFPLQLMAMAKGEGRSERIYDPISSA